MLKDHRLSTAKGREDPIPPIKNQGATSVKGGKKDDTTSKMATSKMESKN